MEKKQVLNPQHKVFNSLRNLPGNPAAADITVVLLSGGQPNGKEINECMGVECQEFRSNTSLFHSISADRKTCAAVLL